jgi:hypothetical protein
VITGPCDTDADLARAGIHPGVDRTSGDEVGGSLHRLGEAPVRCAANDDRQRRALRQGLERQTQPSLGQDRRIDPVGQVAELAGRLLGLLDRRGEDRLQLWYTARGGRAARHPQLVRQGEQPLLRAVVEIALKSAAFCIARFHDPGPGRAKILQLGQDAGLESFVVHREPGRRPDRPLKPISIRGSRVVAHDGDRPTLPDNPRHCLPAARRSLPHRPPFDVQVPSAITRSSHLHV